MNKNINGLIVLLLLVFSVDSIAHEGTPDISLAWRDSEIVVDVRRQSRPLGENYRAFVISYSGGLRPYRNGDAGFSGSGFDQEGFMAYQVESTLLKWSNEQSKWVHDGFSEKLNINPANDEDFVTATSGKGIQLFTEKIGAQSVLGAHPVFTIQRADGTTPDDGVYLMFISMTGVDNAGEQIIYAPSEPFALAFHVNVQGNAPLLELSNALKAAPEVQLNNYKRIDALFDWAESQYAELFPHTAKSRFIQGYYARCYDNSMCVGTKDGKIFTANLDSGNPVEHGTIDHFYRIAGL